jgi:outer membrane lipoprotein LolB
MRLVPWRAAAVLSILALAGCSSMPPPRAGNPGDAGQMAEQVAREQALGTLSDWHLEGRLGITNSEDSRGSGSGSLSWTEQGGNYVFTVDGAFGNSFRLSGGPDGALLEGLGKQPLRDADAEALMQRAVGWSVPLAELRAWVLGLRAAGSQAQLSYGADRLPVVLQQDGWRVEYRAWDTTRQPALPTFVVATKPPYAVRLAIKSWQLK